MRPLMRFLRSCVRASVIAVLASSLVGPAFAASARRPAPEGAPPGAPAEFTSFTDAELMRGFLALAFGSDMRIGNKADGIRRFDRPITVRIASGTGARAQRYRAVVDEMSRKVPWLVAKVTDTKPADIVVWLINEKDFLPAMARAFGFRDATAFVRKTDPQCMTQTQSRPDGTIERATVFIIVDQGNDVFINCAYHETMHAFGLRNHADSNPWTILNQNRTVGYLTEYDRLMLAILYDPAVKPGMTKPEVNAVLPEIVDKINAQSKSASERR